MRSIVLVFVLLSNTFFNLLFASEIRIRPNKSIRLGGYFYGCWKGNNANMSAEQANWAGNHLDVVSAVSTVSGDSVAAMKRRNPLMRFYVMTFATTLYEKMSPGSGWPPFDQQIMSDWVVKLKNGREAIGIRRTSDDSNAHMMDLSSSEWADYYRSYYTKLVKESKADGVAIDEIMWNGYWGVKMSEIGRYTSVEQIRESCHKWLKNISLGNNFKIIHQGFWDGSQHLVADAWAPLKNKFTDEFWGNAQEYTNGIWGEHAFFAEDSESYYRAIYYRKMNWEQSLHVLEETSRHGRTYIWAAWYDRGNKDQLEYCLATYLLGKNGSFVVFQPQPRYLGGYPKNLGGYDIGIVQEEYEQNLPFFDVELGEPLQDAVQVESEGLVYWQRTFKTGLVLCNPSETSTISIRMNKPMFDVYGKVVDVVTLKARSGIILKAGMAFKDKRNHPAEHQF